MRYRKVSTTIFTYWQCQHRTHQPITFQSRLEGVTAGLKTYPVLELKLFSPCVVDLVRIVSIHEHRVNHPIFRIYHGECGNRHNGTLCGLRTGGAVVCRTAPLTKVPPTACPLLLTVKRVSPQNTAFTVKSLTSNWAEICRNILHFKLKCMCNFTYLKLKWPIFLAFVFTIWSYYMTNFAQDWNDFEVKWPNSCRCLSYYVL